MGRWVMAVVMAVAVTGCSANPPVATMLPWNVGTSMLTLPQTKKTPADHVMSAVTGRDCSVLHYEQDGSYCQDAPKEIDRRSLYCFKTLGGVECHQRPDPYYGNERTLASPPPRPVEPD